MAISVFMFGPDLDVMGGISSVMRQYLRNGLQKKVDLTIVPTTKDDSKGKKIIFFFNVILKTWLLLLTNKGDIYHLHVSQDGSFYRKFIIFGLAKAFGRKVIAHIHGAKFEKFMRKNAINRMLVKIMFANADLVISLSNKWKSIIEAFENKSNVVVLYNPAIYPEKIKKMSEGRFNVLFLGRLSNRKGTYDLLDCIKSNRLIFTEHNVKFIIAGDGDVENARDYVDRNKMHQLVLVPGWVSGKKKAYYLSNADIYVLPSYNEQMPMSILEAMAQGVPVISTLVAGIPEMVKDGLNGILIHPGDKKGLSAALVELITNKEKRLRMGQESLKIVAEKFDGEVIIEKLILIYKHI